MSKGTQTIAVTGPGGMVAKALIQTLERSGAPFRVIGISRSPKGDQVGWSPTEGKLEAEKLEGIDAVVHLAGEPIGPARWSDERKQAIRDSRVKGTALLATACAGLRRPPRVFVQASAMGYYGDTGSNWVDEASPQGAGFLAEVCRQWEAASKPAEDAGIRVVRLRFGHVLGEGGLLATLRTPTKLGVGGRLGSGEQFWSWIGIVDLVALILEALGDPSLSGVINAVTAQPVRNADFVEEYASVLSRPAWLPVPAIALKLAFGREQAEEMLLWGQRVRPGVLQRHGFEYVWPGLSAALEAIEGGRIPLPAERATALEIAGSEA